MSATTTWTLARSAARDDSGWVPHRWCGTHPPSAGPVLRSAQQPQQHRVRRRRVHRQSAQRRQVTDPVAHPLILPTADDADVPHRRNGSAFRPDLVSDGTFLRVKGRRGSQFRAHVPARIALTRRCDEATRWGSRISTTPRRCTEPGTRVRVRSDDSRVPLGSSTFSFNRVRDRCRARSSTRSADTSGLGAEFVRRGLPIMSAGPCSAASGTGVRVVADELSADLLSGFTSVSRPS